MTERNEDEPEIDEQERSGRESGAGDSPQKNIKKSGEDVVHVSKHYRNFFSCVFIKAFTVLFKYLSKESPHQNANQR